MVTLQDSYREEMLPVSPVAHQSFSEFKGQGDSLLSPPLDMQKLDISVCNEALAMLKTGGLSVRQLSRLTGISKSVIVR